MGGFCSKKSDTQVVLAVQKIQEQKHIVETKIKQNQKASKKLRQQALSTLQDDPSAKTAAQHLIRRANIYDNSSAKLLALSENMSAQEEMLRDSVIVVNILETMRLGLDAVAGIRRDMPDVSALLDDIEEEREFFEDTDRILADIGVFDDASLQDDLESIMKETKEEEEEQYHTRLLENAPKIPSKKKKKKVLLIQEKLN